MPRPENWRITHNALDPALAIRAGTQALQLFEDPATYNPDFDRNGLASKDLSVGSNGAIELPYGVDLGKYNDLLSVARTAFALRGLPTRKIVSLHVLQPGGFFEAHSDGVDFTVSIWPLLNDALTSFRPYSRFPYVNAKKVIPGDRLEILNRLGARQPHSVKNISPGKRVSLVV